MYVLLIVTAIICLVIFVRLHLYIEYDENGFSGVFKAAFIKVRFPGKKRAKTKIKKEQSGQKKRGGSVSNLVKMIKPLISALGKLMRTVKIHHLFVEIKVATDNAFDTAMGYGRTAAAIGILLSWAENNLRIKKKRIITVADFESAESTVCLASDMSLSVGHALVILAVLAYRLMKAQNIKRDKEQDTKERKEK